MELRHSLAAEWDLDPRSTVRPHGVPLVSASFPRGVDHILAATLMTDDGDGGLCWALAL